MPKDYNLPLDYSDSAALMVDPDFIARIKVACLNFAAYIAGEDPGATAHNTRYKWAQSTLVAADAAAVTVAPTVVMDPNVQAQGPGITDKDLQTAVETAWNKVM